jgi:outer membrane protein assembly factor BamB/tRNA A-37 threonylcarbamoyl transferase component Bud32
MSGDRGQLDGKDTTQSLDGEPAASRRQLRAGTALAKRYSIEEVIGVGGMGSVYRARDLHFPNITKLVAVKEMLNTAPDPLVRQTVARNFEREANLLATLAHPSIPTVYDYFSDEDRSYLVLEFIHGQDLEAIINDTAGFLPEEQVLGWAMQLCDVLSFLHGHQPDPIIFRDMKPSNVMIDTAGDVKLVDFGIARTFQTGQRGTMIGTEGYSPPEQYRGEASPSADLYALGATIHHALTRRDPRLEPPFSFAERPLRKINPQISAELDAAITTALAYSPAERFSNAAAMKEALLGVARKTGAQSQPRPVSTAPVGGVKPIWSFKCEDEIRGAPLVAEGTVYIGCYDNNLYALNAGDGKFQWKYATDGGVVSRPAIYEGHIFFGSQDQRLHVVNGRSGKVVWTYFTEGPIHSSPRIAEGHVFIGSDDHHLHAVNVKTSRSAWSFDAGDKIRSTPMVANDLVYVGTENGELLAVDYGGTLKWSHQAKRAITSSPTAASQAVFVSSLDGTVYCLDAREGWVIWRFRLGKGSVSSPVLADNLLIVGAADGVLYCMEIQTGREVWGFRTEHQISSSPAIYRDAVYCGSVDGHLYCLEYRTGRQRWKFDAQAAVTGSAVVFDDIVYLGATNHQMYALLA